jgi:hypothetical protein
LSSAYTAVINKLKISNILNIFFIKFPFLNVII